MAVEVEACPVLVPEQVDQVAGDRQIDELVDSRAEVLGELGEAAQSLRGEVAGQLELEDGRVAFKEPFFIFVLVEEGLDFPLLVVEFVVGIILLQFANGNVRRLDFDVFAQRKKRLIEAWVRRGQSSSSSIGSGESCAAEMESYLISRILE